MTGLLESSLAAPRFRTGLMAAFAGTALLLAILGIAGVMSYSVARGTRELGVRLALGAEPAAVRGLVMGKGIRLTVVGVSSGLIGALGLVRVLGTLGTMDALLFDVSARDPLVYAGVATVLGFAALVACFLPALRASRVDPATALTVE